MTKEKSKCCNAPVQTKQGRADIDLKDLKQGSTYWFECTKCNKPCDLSPQSKEGVEKVVSLLVGDDIIEYFINNGWEIIANAPNPYPEPYIFFCIRKKVDSTFDRKAIFIAARTYIDNFQNNG